MTAASPPSWRSSRGSVRQRGWWLVLGLAGAILMAFQVGAAPLGEFHLRDEASGVCLRLQPDARAFRWLAADGREVRGELLVILQRDPAGWVTGLRFQEVGRTSRLRGEVWLADQQASASWNPNLVPPPPGQAGEPVLHLSKRPFTRTGCEPPAPPPPPPPPRPGTATPPTGGEPVPEWLPAPTRQPVASVVTILEALPPLAPPPKPVAAVIPADPTQPPPPRQLPAAQLSLNDPATGECLVLRFAQWRDLGERAEAEFCWLRTGGETLRGRARFRLEPAAGAIETLVSEPVAGTVWRLEGTVSLARWRAELGLHAVSPQALTTLTATELTGGACDCPATPIVRGQGAPPFTVERGRVIPTREFRLEAELLHAAMSYGGVHAMPITLRLFVGRESFEPWGPADQPRLRDAATAGTRFVTRGRVTAQTPVTVGARAWRLARPWEGVGDGPWEAHLTIEPGEVSRQLLFLRRGDTVPRTVLGPPTGDGPPAWLRLLLDGGRVAIPANELLILGELSTNDAASPLMNHHELAIRLRFLAP